MHHTHTVNRVSGIVLLLLSASAHALGLGEIEVTSSLGQPFYAEIPLELPAGLAPSETQLAADIPSYSEHAELGLDNPLLARGLRVEVIALQTAAPYLRITSERPVSEPALNFLVRTNSTAGQRVREYSVLLDPPAMGKSNATGVATKIWMPKRATLPNATLRLQTKLAPPARPFESNRNAVIDNGEDLLRQDDTLWLPTIDMTSETLSTTQPAPVASDALDPIAGDVYGPIVAGETLYSIARRVRLTQPGRLDAIVQRLFETNPQAFDNGDIDRLREGAMLELVEAGSVQSSTTEELASREPAPDEPAPAAQPQSVAPAADETGSKVVREMEEKVEKANWMLHAAQKENTTLNARLARLEERFAALQEKRAELERQEQQLAERLQSFAQTEAPARPQATPETRVATTVPADAVAAGAKSGRPVAAAPSEKPRQGPITAWMQRLLPMGLDASRVGLLAILVAALTIALFLKRRKRHTPTPEPLLARVDDGAQDDLAPPEDVHVAFLADDALTGGMLPADALADQALAPNLLAVDAPTDDTTAAEKPAEDARAAGDAEAKVIDTDAGKAQELADEVSLYMAYAQYDRAKATIEEAIALDPRDEHKVILLSIYAAMGQHEEAKALTQELLARPESLGDDLRVQVEDITRKCA